MGVENQQLWGDIKALIVRKSADCKILFKKLGYSNRAVSNFNRTVNNTLI